MMIWWHHLRGHATNRRRVTVPMFDPSSRGWLIKCSCGREWAR